MLGKSPSGAFTLFNGFPSDPETSRILEQEIKRQQETINLIAAENYDAAEISSQAMLDKFFSE